MSPRRVLLAPLAFLAVAITWTIAAAPALADPVSSAALALKSNPYYLDPGATIDGQKITVDSGKVTAAFGSYVKVAILPSGTSTETALNSIAPSLTGNFALAVFAGNKFAAGSTNLKRGYALNSLQSVAKAHSTQLRDGEYTDALVAWAQDVTSAKKGNSGSTNGGNSNASSNSSSAGGSAWPWLAGLGGLAVLGGGGYAVSRRRKAARAVSEAKASVMPYYDRLASDVNTLNAGDNATARQALSDASERYTSAGSQMSTATTVAQWSAVRRTALEGLQAAQTAREALGLSKGPELPPIDEQPRGEQLTEAQQVTVQGQQYQGYPSYTPGAPYYYGGGGGYAGGWYNFPFWETMLIGSMIGGGWGGGGGYGSGYDNGFQAGENAANDSNANDSGGGWGDFGGGGGGGFGDFGGGGGDFGGGGGGDGGSF